VDGERTYVQRGNFGGYIEKPKTLAEVDDPADLEAKKEL